MATRWRKLRLKGQQPVLGIRSVAVHRHRGNIAAARGAHLREEGSGPDFPLEPRRRRAGGSERDALAEKFDRIAKRIGASPKPPQR